MNTVTLQVPMSKTLRQQAQIVADEYGFSSIQEVIRLFLNRFSQKSISLNFGEPTVVLSAKAEKRYLKMEEDFRAGRNFKTANSLNDFFAQLEAK
jgi:antitoxin component of RelBE/YafQ-DinJ toxin-antitoxin module